MSRWIDAFESHDFHKDWKNLKEQLATAKVGDETVTTSVEELVRLRKAVKYIDEILRGIDPELVPPQVWNDFQAQASACQSQISTFNDNKNVANLNKANQHVDNLLTYVRPYMIVGGSAAEALREAVQEAASSIEKFTHDSLERASKLITQITSTESETVTLRDKALEAQNEIGDYHAELFRSDENNPGIKSRVESMITYAEDVSNELEQLSEKIFQGDSSQESIRDSIYSAQEDFNQRRTEIEKQLTSVKADVSELREFHVKIFGETETDADGEEARGGGLESQLDLLKSKLSDFDIEQKKKYSALNDQIESLLPGATSAGLATAYKEMKDSFNTPVIFSSVVFYLSIVGLIFVSYGVATQPTLEAALAAILDQSLIYLPVVWLAYYSSKRRGEAQRLQQEYAHKEALAKSYMSYKNQLQELGDENGELQKQLISKAIDAIAYNASETLDNKHGDKMPVHELAEKLAKSLPDKLAQIIGKTPNG